jgi:two-component system nitrate/nitrite response regulator NarL
MGGMSVVVVDPIRVVVADNSPARPVIADALRGAGIRVLGETVDGSAALDLIRAHHPQVALVGERIPGVHGAALATAVRREHLPTRVLILSPHAHAAAADEDAAGVVPIDATRTDIVEAVLLCANGSRAWNRYQH